MLSCGQVLQHCWPPYTKIRERGFRSDPIELECEHFCFLKSNSSRRPHNLQRDPQWGSRSFSSPHFQNLLWCHNCKLLFQPPQDYLFVWNIWLSPQVGKELLTNTRQLLWEKMETPKGCKDAQHPQHTHSKSVTHHGVGNSCSVLNTEVVLDYFSGRNNVDSAFQS